MSERGDEPASAHNEMRDRSLVGLLLAGTFGLQALTVISGIITARLLGVEGRGQVALVFAVGLAASQFTLGGSLPNAIAKNLAERRLAARDGLRSVVRRRGWWLAVPSVLSGMVMLTLLPHESTQERYGLAVAVVVMTVQTIALRVLIGSLQGEVGHLGRMAAVGLIPQLLFSASLATAWVVGWDWGVFEVLLSLFVSSCLGLIAGFFALAPPTAHVEHELDEGELWAESRRTYLSSVRPVDSVGLDRILVGALLGSGALGLYAAATAVSNLCSIVGNSISVIVLPRVAMNHADPHGQRALIRRWVIVSGVLMAFVITLLELIVAPAIRIAFGEEFTGATSAARWLVLADGLLGMRKVFISILQGQGRGGTASWIELVLTPCMILGIVFAAQHDTLTGIGITMVCVGALSCVALGLTVVRGPTSRSGKPVPRHRRS